MQSIQQFILICVIYQNTCKSLPKNRFNDQDEKKALTLKGIQHLLSNLRGKIVAKNEIVLNLEKEGEILTFFGEPDSKAPAVEFNCVLAPGAKGPDPHVHTVQTETFHVTSGTMIARIKGQEDVTLTQGEKIVIPPGKVHSFTNGSKDEPLVTRIVVEPALDFQWFLSEAAKSAIRNGGSWKASPLLEVGHLMWLSSDQHRIGLPLFVEYLLFGSLSILARMTGKAKNIAPKP